MKNLEDFSTQKQDQRRMKRHEEGREEESSTPAVVGSTDDSRNEWLRDPGPNACKDGTSEQDEATTSDTSKSVQPSLKPNKSLDKRCERESREQKNLKREKGWRTGKHSDTRQDVERPHTVKPSKEADRVDTDQYRNHRGSKNAETRSENNRKRKGQELERNETQHKSISPNPFDRQKQDNNKKTEIKTQPLTQSDIWEEGIKVKPQKKISININLDGKRKKIDQDCSSQSIAEKTNEENEKTGNGEKKVNRDPEAKVKPQDKLSRNKEGVCEEKIKPAEAETSKVWEKGTFREVEIWEKFPVEEEDIGEKKKDREDEDFDLWHCALRGVVEEKGSERLWDERDGMKASKGEEVTKNERRSMTGKKQGEERIRNESQGQEMAELVQNSQKEGPDGKSMWNKNREVTLDELKAKRKEELMEGVKRTIKKEEATIKSEEQTSTQKRHRNSPNTAVDYGRSECYCFGV